MTIAPKFPLAKNKKIVLFSFALVILGLALIFIFKPRKTTDPEAFAKYIESYTSGTISKKSFIRIHLASAVKHSVDLGKPEQNALFSFSPNIKGKTYWIDSQTLEFRPDEHLKPGQTYEASFDLEKVTQPEKGFEEFNFDFTVIKPGLSLAQTGLVSQNNTSLSYMKLTGEINTADFEVPANIEKTLHVDFNQKLKIKWTHDSDKNRSSFTIDSIKKNAKDETLTLSYTGDPIGADHKGVERIVVPAQTIFKVLDIKAIQGEEDYALVQCSEPVNVAQDLNGLVTLGNLTNLHFTIDGSQIKIYAPDELQGNYQVTVSAAVANIEGKTLESAKTASILFEDKLPGVTISGSGTILPKSGKLVLPFDAINLKAVDVTVIKIYESNIPQFFQVNNYKDGMELRRVAKPIVQKTIHLDGDKSINLHKKTRFTLDLDRLLRTEPGAMYRVTIGFRQAYTTYACSQTSTQVDNAGNIEDEEYENYTEKIDEEDDFWERYESYYPANYRWSDRDNPCTPSFYTNERWASRNLLASNIGLIAKRGNDNSMLIVATDLLTAKPISGVTLNLVDYQQQLISTQNTDGDGFARFDLKRKPYLLIAKKDNERGYLKLDDGNSLPLSRFDVGGDVVQNGIKGFIYTERGVWRPGDSLFVSFLLEDKLKNLPDRYPVTLELFNPKGQLDRKLTSTQSLNGFYTFKTATENSSPTGNWTAKVKVGGATFSKTIKIETIMPNRLKISFDLGNASYLGKGAPSASTLSAKWLFGTPAQHLRAKVDVSLNTMETKFKGFEGFSFDNPTLAFESQIKTIFDGTLSATGTAQVNTQLSDGNIAPGVLRANFTTKVFEPGGGFSIDNFTIPYHVYDSYLGLKAPAGDKLSGMLLTDRNHKFELVNLSSDGKLIPGTKTAQVEVYKVQWRWWWQQDDEQTFANFTQNEYNKLISKHTVTLSNGRGIFNFRINEPEWGRYLILVRDENGGHTTGKVVYVDWPNWAQREQANNPTEASMLSFTANKQKFMVGDDITLTIPTGENGRALVSIENGSRVLKTYWVNTKKGQTQFSFKAEATMAPNVFANVSLLQPHAQTINDLPIRMYGAIPLSIEDPQTILKPVIKMPLTLRPETESNITISEQSGKPMTYTIALVDEGLLDLTRFKTPNPYTTFYAREGLGVKTWDLFDQVLGAWGGNLERILSIGGDGTINRNLNPAKANRFKPVVKFLGPFYLEKNAKQLHRFKLPQYIGSVRAMVVAGQNGAYGIAEQSVEVKKPLMVLATLPRVIGPGESFTLPINIFATNNQLKLVNVSLKATNLKVEGSTTQQISFKSIGEQMAYFKISVPNQVGIAKVNIIAQSGAEKTSYDVELDIRNPNPFVTNVISAVLQPNQNWSTKYNPIGMANTNTGTLEVSSIPPINLNKHLSYLINYPHGCVEQITSSVFPQLYLDKLTPLSNQKKAEIERNIKVGINRLRGFQNAEGGLSYWPGQNESDDWGTNYASHFLTEAQLSGYSVPQEMIDLLVRFQKSKANNWAPSSNNFSGGDLTQAYRLYVLALARKPEISAMNRLKAFQYLSVAAKWRLAAGYQLIGQTAVANSLIKGLPQSASSYQQLNETYGSELRDEAMIMETLTLLGQKAQAAKLLQTVGARLGKNSWYSTQTTAYALLAIAKFCGGQKNAAPLQFSYDLNAQHGNIANNQFLYTLPIAFKSNTASVTNKGSSVLFVRLVLQGQPAAGQNNFLPNNSNLLVMDVKYKTLRGQAMDPSLLKQGTDFYAEVTVKNTGKQGSYQQMALTQIFPSGWEIINTRLNDNENILSSSPYTYRDVRDDRVFTYFNIRENETLTYKVLLNASYIGRYYLSAVQCEAMYNNNITATRAGKWVQVVK